MNIGSISWPEDAKEACKFYLRFLIEVVESIDFRFPDFAADPLVTAKTYVEDKVSEEEYRSQVAGWWNYLDSAGALCEMRDPSALAARLAICLLSATTDQAKQLGEHLSWFLEVLEFLGVDQAETMRKMNGYFFRSPSSL